MTLNPWAVKARALDRYRWRLLRERHSLLGSALRFAREALGDWWFGLRAKYRLASSVEVDSCDFLLLQSAPKVIAFQRKKLLIEGVRGRGYHLLETALRPPRAILRERLLKRPRHAVPTRYFGMAAHAEWLVQHHQPRVLLNDRNGSLYAPFLRLALAASGGLLVHLAHATTVERSRRLGMNDYDYYFLFGQSSLEALQARTLRFGSSTAVLVGSHMIDDSYVMPAPDLATRTLLILGVGPDKEKESAYQQTYALLASWARRHPEYRVLVKPHPRSQAPFWQGVVQATANVELLGADCSLAAALKRASVVVNILSNAVIEAALAGRPVLCVDLGGQQDIFQQQRFFGPVIRGEDELEQRLLGIEADFGQALEQSRAFAEFHLAHGAGGLASTLDALQRLHDGNSLSAELRTVTLEAHPANL